MATQETSSHIENIVFKGARDDQSLIIVGRKNGMMKKTIAAMVFQPRLICPDVLIKLIPFVYYLTQQRNKLFNIVYT